MRLASRRPDSPASRRRPTFAQCPRQNLKNAFQLEFAVQGLHIALVDDVVTTGSTVAEISRLLLRNGAATVQVWCLCRTL
ncbi:TPA: phosphoribosyltransferase family protein [Klebsiella pneumoniae]